MKLFYFAPFILRRFFHTWTCQIFTFESGDDLQHHRSPGPTSGMAPRRRRGTAAEPKSGLARRTRNQARTEGRTPAALAKLCARAREPATSSRPSPHPAAAPTTPARAEAHDLAPRAPTSAMPPGPARVRMSRQRRSRRGRHRRLSARVFLVPRVALRVQACSALRTTAAGAARRCTGSAARYSQPPRLLRRSAGFSCVASTARASELRSCRTARL